LTPTAANRAEGARASVTASNAHCRPKYPIARAHPADARLQWPGVSAQPEILKVAEILKELEW